MVLDEMLRDLIRYGRIIHDAECEFNGVIIRNRTFTYQTGFYQVLQCNGEILEIVRLRRWNE